MSELLCPNDGTALRGIDRSGVHVDACPTCRGVWLDRGELDKIVERERADLDDFEQEIRGASERERDSRSVGYVKPRKKKKRSILEDFLDFG
jgi:Zn-finger nucleic acid-binding protein